MNIGSVVYATKSGLGILAKDFYDNGIINNVLIEPHEHYENNFDWYPKQDRIIAPGRKFGGLDGFGRHLGPNQTSSLKEVDVPPALYDFVKKNDILFLFEIPFYHDITRLCRKMKKKIILMPMYECTPYPIDADVYICPSKLDFKVYKASYPNKPIIFTPVPISRQINFKLRKKAKVFVHNAGNGGTLGRNGTNELMQAMKYVKSPIKLLIRTQKNIDHLLKTNTHILNDNRVRIFTGTVPYEKLWSLGDVFVFPEKFNGLSLPMQEAFASGMLVMGGNRFPMNDWLPNECLIDISNYEKKGIVGVPFASAQYDPKLIAAKIDEWYDKDIEEYSLMGKEFGYKNNWDSLQPVYESLIEKTLGAPN